jgi:hypothetical protein
MIWVLLLVLLLVLVLAQAGLFLMLHRNSLTAKWRHRANERWFYYAQMIHKAIDVDAEAFCGCPEHHEIFMDLMKRYARFHELYEELPDYDSMMWNFRAWNYGTATGDYEKKLEEHFMGSMALIQEVKDNPVVVHE